MVLRNIFYEANSVTDWIASYIVEHYREIFWTSMGSHYHHFMIFYFLIFLVIFILDLYECSILSKKKN